MHSFIGLAKITKSPRARRCRKDTHACQFLYTVYRKWDVRCNQYKKNLTAHSRMNTYCKWRTWIKLRKIVRFSQTWRSLNFGITFLVFLFLFGMQMYQNIPYDISCFCGSFGFCAVLRIIPSILGITIIILKNCPLEEYIQLDFDLFECYISFPLSL